MHAYHAVGTRTCVQAAVDTWGRKARAPLWHLCRCTAPSAGWAWAQGQRLADQAPPPQAQVSRLAGEARGSEPCGLRAFTFHPDSHFTPGGFVGSLSFCEEVAAPRAGGRRFCGTGRGGWHVLCGEPRRWRGGDWSGG